jgi:DNA/RNA-binding domain of Phe-tRNA-synthetase-like protein
LLNAVSLEFNLPISLLSIAKCSLQLFIDRGQPEEYYVFNAGGQTLELADLLTVFDISGESPRPVGTPVKDSLAGKIEASDQHVVAIIYAPNSDSAIERCNQAKSRLRSGFISYCGAEVRM